LKALIIDDEPVIRLALGHFLRQRNYEVLEAENGLGGLEKAQKFLPDLVLLDQRLPDVDGDDILPHLLAPEIGARVIMMTAYVEIDRAVQVMKSGAEYFFSKPLDLVQVGLILDRIEDELAVESEIRHYRQLFEQPGTSKSIVGQSGQMLKVQRLIDLLATNISTPVLIFGESGAGKELVARAIHRQSRLTGPLIEINSASLSEALLESELFGHEKGAYTDAKSSKSGLFELAADGTIFFDELAEMPLAIQAKLLKVLDTKIFRRVGGVTDLKSSARFIGATNRDLVDMVKKGLFREDLYYRINVLPVHVPPLRDRGRDVVMLAEYFVRELSREMGKGKVHLTSLVVDSLVRHNWPGNVRELKNVIERALILVEGKEINLEHLPRELRTANYPSRALAAGEEIIPLHQVEDAYINQVLSATGNNHSRTAALLKISRSTLLARIRKMQSDVQ
jgi:DNA-binding NtrC family response regulator